MTEIRLIDVATTYPLRIAVLRNGIAKDYQFVGDHEFDTFHVGAFSDEECVGIATCVKKEHKLFSDKESYQLRGMAIKADLQKSGIGAKLVLKTFEIMTDRNCHFVWCNAREKAVGFYEKLGFEVIGERFQIPKVGPHYVMFKSF